MSSKAFFVVVDCPNFTSNHQIIEASEDNSSQFHKISTSRKGHSIELTNDSTRLLCVRHYLNPGNWPWPSQLTLHNPPLWTATTRLVAMPYVELVVSHHIRSPEEQLNQVISSPAEPTHLTTRHSCSRFPSTPECGAYYWGQNLYLIFHRPRGNVNQGDQLKNQSNNLSGWLKSLIDSKTC